MHIETFIEPERCRFRTDDLIRSDIDLMDGDPVRIPGDLPIGRISSRFKSCIDCTAIRIAIKIRYRPICVICIGIRASKEDEASVRSQHGIGFPLGRSCFRILLRCDGIPLRIYDPAAQKQNNCQQAYQALFSLFHNWDAP